MNNKEADAVIQEYRNMHSQLEVLNDELPQIKDYIDKTYKTVKQYSYEVNNQRDGLKNQINLFKQTQKKAQALLDALDMAAEKLNEINSRMDVIEKRIGLTRERKMQEETGTFTEENRTILERLDSLEKTVVPF